MNRRDFVRSAPWAMGAGALGLSVVLSACQRPVQPIRVASNVWLGYEPMFLARELGFLSESVARLVEFPSNTACLTALVNHEVSLGALTLDEFLLAREGGVDLRAVLVFDESNGADVVLGGPNVQTLTDLRGKRIGVESSAVGALMLTKLLDLANLSAADVVKVEVTLERHVEAFRKGQVDAIVTFEPVASQLVSEGARRLLDSSRFPGLIVDVLVAHTSDLVREGDQIRQLLAAYFQALDYWLARPQDAARLMAPRLQLTPDQVVSSFGGISVPDLVGNRAWLTGGRPRLMAAAETVGAIMQRTHLLKAAPNLAKLCDASFLPESA